MQIVQIFCETRKINISPTRIEFIGAYHCKVASDKLLFLSEIKAFSPFIFKIIEKFSLISNSFVQRPKELGIRCIYTSIRLICFVSQTCVLTKEMLGGKSRGNIGKISVSDHVGVNRGVEFPSAPGVSFPVAILSRTWYALRFFAPIVSWLAKKIASLIYRAWHCQVWTVGMFVAEDSTRNKHLVYRFLPFLALSVSLLLPVMLCISKA